MRRSLVSSDLDDRVGMWACGHVSMWAAGRLWQTRRAISMGFKGV